MRKALAVFAMILTAIAASGKPRPLKADLIAPGRTIVLVSTAMFVENPEDCVWEYSPQVPQKGPVLIRGTGRILTVVLVGGGYILAVDDPMFGETLKTVRVDRENLKNEKVFRITD